MTYRPLNGARVLQPYDPPESISPDKASTRAGRTPETLRSWASLSGLGRRVGGRWENIPCCPGNVLKWGFCCSFGLPSWGSRWAARCRVLPTNGPVEQERVTASVHEQLACPARIRRSR